VFLPINVNHKQHGNSFRFIPNRADCVPALLSRYSIDTIWSDQASFVLKDESGQFEGDSAVGPLISEILGIVPFVAHIVYTECITNADRCGDVVRAAGIEAARRSSNSWFGDKPSTWICKRCGIRRGTRLGTPPFETMLLKAGDFVGEPMDLSKRVFWETRSFEDAYPTVEAADLEYIETGRKPHLTPRRASPREFNNEPRRKYHNIRHGVLSSSAATHDAVAVD
jgi:hypothetical protein